MQKSETAFEGGVMIDPCFVNESRAIAVIYTRVSSSGQIKNGDGLNSQETRCREFARARDYHVVEVFQDGVSGGMLNRSGMESMLEFLRENRELQPFVIIDDISRLARDVIAHWELRTTIEEAGGKLVSPSIAFGDDSDSVLVENLLASVSQHQRQKNAEQVKNRMIARSMNGYWCFPAPVGYRFKKVSGHGKLLIPDEPVASILKEALEGFAMGRFQSQTEVKAFLESKPDYPKDNKRGEVHLQRIRGILERPIYAGFVHMPVWDVSMRKGQHEPLISWENFQRIKRRLSGGALAPSRVDLAEDFPLRGAVECVSCGRPLTAAWSTGRDRKYPYYFCFTKGCSLYRKSIGRGKIETAFGRLLHGLIPSRDLVEYFHTVCRDSWNERRLDGFACRKELASRIDDLDAEITELIERVVETTNPMVITAYEKRIAQLNQKRTDLENRRSNVAQPTGTFDAVFEPAISFLANPQKLWGSRSIEDKRTVLKLTFANRLGFCRETGFRTPELSMPFKVLADISAGKKSMVDVDGESLNQVLEELRQWNHQLPAQFKDVSRN